MNSNNELKVEVLRRLGLATANAFHTSTQIQSYVNTSYIWASCYHRWPQTEAEDLSVLTVADQEEYSLPASIITDSIFALKIGSYVYEKLIFEDYLKYRTTNDTSSEYIFTDLGHKLRVNPKAFSASASIMIYAHKIPTSLSADGATTIFSGSDEDCNEAIVKYAYGLALAKTPGNIQKALNEKAEARDILDKAWLKYAKSQAGYGTKQTDLFKRVDLLEGKLYEDTDNPYQF